MPAANIGSWMQSIQLLSHWTRLRRCLPADLWLPCLQRVVDVRYSWPSNLPLTQDCVDMINKIFVNNPEQRISIAGIQLHPWFTKNLPDELKVWCTGRQLEGVVCCLVSSQREQLFEALLLRQGCLKGLCRLHAGLCCMLQAAVGSYITLMDMMNRTSHVPA